MERKANNMFNLTQSLYNSIITAVFHLDNLDYLEKVSLKCCKNRLSPILKLAVASD